MCHETLEVNTGPAQAEFAFQDRAGEGRKVISSFPTIKKNK